MEIIAKIEGIDCANCALTLERKINKIDGVKCMINFMICKMNLEYTTPDQLEQVKSTIKKFDNNIDFGIIRKVK